MTPLAARAKLGIAKLARSLQEDVKWGLHDLAVNAVGGSVVVPRVVRFLIYRAHGASVRTPNIFPGCTLVGGEHKLSVGAGTFINRSCYIESVAPVTIGEDCRIGMQVLFVTSTHPFSESGTFSSTASALPIHVGDRCWIGARTTILPGVTLGDDVVVAAGSVVAKDCAAGGLYAGTPARRIRTLTTVDATAPPESATGTEG